MCRKVEKHRRRNSAQTEQDLGILGLSAQVSENELDFKAMPSVHNETQLDREVAKLKSIVDNLEEKAAKKS